MAVFIDASLPRMIEGGKITSDTRKLFDIFAAMEFSPVISGDHFDHDSLGSNNPEMQEHSKTNAWKPLVILSMWPK